MNAQPGKGEFLGKRDIKFPFRLLTIFSVDFDLLGFTFLGNYYIDECLPMVSLISCKVFKEFLTFLQWATVQISKLTTIYHYHEDFIFAGKDAEPCQDIMIALQNICKNLGVPLAEHKS